MTHSLLSIGQATEYLGGSKDSLQRWESEGLTEPAARTAGEQRRYEKAKQLAPFNHGAQALHLKALKKTISDLNRFRFNGIL